MKQTQLLDSAIEDFLRFRRSMDLSKNTVKQDASTLRQFLASAGNVWVHMISDAQVTRFFEEAAKTRQPQSMRNDYTRLQTFFDWARQTGRMPKDSDPMYGRRKPKRAHKERNRVHVSKFPALLDAAEARCPRDRMVVALLLYTLARDGEITDLRIRDVDLDAGYIMMRVHKARKEDRMPISAELDKELRRWLTVYAEDAGFLEPHYYLVPSRVTKSVFGDDGRIASREHVRLTPEQRYPQLNKIVNPALEDIGFPTRDANGRPLWEGAHTIRRSGARAFFDKLSADGYDFALRIVQSTLHHSSMQTTELYLGLSADRRNRDEIIKGRSMYGLDAENVAQLRREA